MHKGKGSGLLPWPQRLTTPPLRLEEIGISAEEFQLDTVSAMMIKACYLLLPSYAMFAFKVTDC